MVANRAIKLAWVLVCLLGCQARKTSMPASDLWVSRFRDNLGIRLSFDGSAHDDQGVTYAAAGPGDDSKVSLFIALLSDELGKYSKLFLHNIKLKEVVLCKDLSVEGQSRMAVPEPDRERMLFDFNHSADNPIGEVQNIHHELFHYAIGALKGSMYWRDPVWGSLNPPGFQYGNGGRYDRKERSADINHPAPGFINVYAQSGEEEDMAELESCRHTYYCNELLTGWVKQDRYLAKKCARLDEILAPYR